MPMKIDGMTPQGPSVTMTHDHDERTEGSDADFSTALMDEEDTVSTEALEKMLQQIDEQGARLSRTPTYDELMGPHGAPEGLYDGAQGGQEA